MADTIINHLFSFLLAFLLAASIAYIIYSKIRMAASKARFALLVVTSITICFLSLLNFLSGSVFLEIISTILVVTNQVAGRQVVTTIPPGPPYLYGVLGVAVAFLVVGAIWRFGERAILSWDTRPTITVSELAKQNRDNSLIFLAFAEATRIVRRHPDLIASDAALNWKQQTAEAPLPPKWNVLARSLFCSAFSEVLIEDGGWRDRIASWVGFIDFSRVDERRTLYLMIFSGEYNSTSISDRISIMIDEGYDLTGVRLFAAFDSRFYVEKRENIQECSVEVWSKDSLLRKGLSFDAYAGDLIRRFDYETLGGTSATLSSTYVNAHVIRERHGEERYDLARLYDGWIRESSRRHLAIVGEYGQGKSTAMLALCVKWARTYLKHGPTNSLVPLLIELRSQSPSETDPSSFLAPWASRFGLDPRRIYNLIQAGEAVLIFEGFDELRNAGRAYDRHEHFNALWRLAYPGTKLIFTGRPNFFIDEVEKNTTLRVDRSKGAAGNAYTDLWEIDRLEPDEVMKALSGFDAEMAKSVLVAAEEHTSFRDIVSRPSMLPVVATIWPEIEELQRRGQKLTDAILIERYLDAVYQRKEAEIESYQRVTGASPGATYLVLPRELREVLTSLLVWDMINNDARNTITRTRFDRVISDSYRNVFRVFQSLGTSSATVEAIRRIEVKFKDITDAEFSEIISNEIASAGLFVSDPVGGVNNLRLPHKQYYEYIIAKTAYEATIPGSRMRVLVLGPDRNDSIIARNVLREPNAIVYFSEVCGSDFRWFNNVIVKTIIILDLTVLSTVIEANRLSRWLKERLNVRIGISFIVIDDLLDVIYSSANSVGGRSGGAIFVAVLGLGSAVGVAAALTVAIPSIGIDKAAKTGLLLVATTAGVIVTSLYLSRYLPKVRLLEYVVRVQRGRRGLRSLFVDGLPRRRIALREALDKLGWLPLTK
ncbi:NACHT domain-containing protein [Mesorhizobium sp. M1273]|uniref:NACHT domain-containing protein n=1 Tax=Mesorhizobium sp. M1273 TaxID=2957075 RepID=UPI00333C449C